jgi:hypothetical protein
MTPDTRHMAAADALIREVAGDAHDTGSGTAVVGLLLLIVAATLGFVGGYLFRGWAG